jgi:hypothetical protein
MIRQGQVAIFAFGFTSTSLLTMVGFVRMASKQVRPWWKYDQLDPQWTS